MPQPKIAIIHDAFLYKWGGERFVTLLANALGADLIAGFFSPGSFDPRDLGFTGEMIALGKPIEKKVSRHLILKWRFLTRAALLRDYDIVIFSWDCLPALRHIQKGSTTFYYCHTPPRYLFDFREQYLARISPIFRPIFSLAFTFFARAYIRDLDRFHRIFTNSLCTQERLQDFCHHDSTILYPPVDTTRFSPGEKNTAHEYFLSFARLSPPKRVDVIIDAFREMPEKRLIFTYGKNDPEKEKILAKIHAFPNIEAIESPDDAVLISLIRGALAVIYIPINEDFGMTPVESMACGIPVIGVDEGWLRETILDGKTGFLLSGYSDSDTLQKKLKNVIQTTNTSVFVSMKHDCVARAEVFSLEKFEKTLQSFIISS